VFIRGENYEFHSLIQYLSHGIEIPDETWKSLSEKIMEEVDEYNRNESEAIREGYTILRNEQEGA